MAKLLEKGHISGSLAITLSTEVIIEIPYIVDHVLLVQSRTITF